MAGCAAMPTPRSTWTPSRTFVLVRAGQVIGFFSLTMGSVLRRDAPARLVRGLPRYPFGVVVLARLAVDGTEHGSGFGAFLLAEALVRAAAAGEAAAARLVVVDAIDDSFLLPVRRGPVCSRGVGFLRTPAPPPTPPGGGTPEGGGGRGGGAVPGVPFFSPPARGGRFRQGRRWVPDPAGVGFLLCVFSGRCGVVVGGPSSSGWQSFLGAAASSSPAGVGPANLTPLRPRVR